MTLRRNGSDALSFFAGASATYDILISLFANAPTKRMELGESELSGRSGLQPQRRIHLEINRYRKPQLGFNMCGTC